MSTSFIRCRCAHFRDGYDSPYNAFEYIDDAIVVTKNGLIDKVIPTKQFSDFELSDIKIQDKRPALMLPGFIDAHVHSPQLPMIASHGEQLLDWLKKYTFPSELKCQEIEYSKNQSQTFINSLLEHGTTTAFIFTTSYKHNTEDIFDTALVKDMRIIAGKVLMDRHAPQDLLDGKRGIIESRELISKYHNNSRLGYAVTPRFSPTSTPEQLKQAGNLLEEFPDLWMQTHLSENISEINWAKSLFPSAKDYLNTYEMYGLHSDRSIYAHSLHLSDSEKQRLADSGSTIAFCPSSNLFLGSGLLDLQSLKTFNINYALASDVGAGTSLSMLETMGDAYKVAQLQNYSLSPFELYYSSTLGAAKALKLDQFIGNLCPGKEADFILLDSRLDPKIHSRMNKNQTIEEEMFIYTIMGNDRIISETFIAGKNQYSNPLNRSMEQ